VRTALTLLAFVSALAEEAPEFPSWLESYPGAAPVVRANGLVRESTYTVAAQPAAVVAYYRKKIEAAGLAIEATETSIRVGARECDLLIRITAVPEGSSVDATCTAIHWTRVSASPSPKLPGTTFHRVRHDAPAPTLVWPAWLTHIDNKQLRIQTSSNPAGDAMLTARYTTTVPMTDLHSFYRDLLNAHEYPATSRLQTGHTQTGIQQNAYGSVSGFNYPDGAPGAYSTIDVTFDRSVLNGPITVSMRFTTHAFIAKRGY
jgi:hypothetical protein